jgi:hypothetical protein
MYVGDCEKYVKLRKFYPFIIFSEKLVKERHYSISISERLGPPRGHQRSAATTAVEYEWQNGGHVGLL